MGGYFLCIENIVVVSLMNGVKFCKMEEIIK